MHSLSPRPRWLGGQAGDWKISVWAQPGAVRSEIVGDHDDCLKIRVGSAPVDGRANDALCAFLSRRLGVARSQVEVELGQTARRKRVRISLDCDATRIVDSLKA